MDNHSDVEGDDDIESFTTAVEGIANGMYFSLTWSYIIPL